MWIANGAKFLHADNEDWSDCADLQSDFSLRWGHSSDGTISRVVAHFSTRGTYLAASAFMTRQNRTKSIISGYQLYYAYLESCNRSHCLADNVTLIPILSSVYTEKKLFLIYYKFLNTISPYHTCTCTLYTLHLTFTAVWANSADDKYIFSIFP